MDYNLNALSTRQFEQLTQSLLVKSFGPAVSVYGDGPDGGREATWNGKVPALTGSEEWDGYGVLQAKMRLRPLAPADNLSWLKTQVREELAAWVKVGNNRTRKPDYLIFATNVVLSPDPRAGKDAISSYIAQQLTDLRLDIKQVLVLSYTELCGLLDDAPGIRHSYAALITPGDIIARMLREQENDEEEFALALRAHAARSLRDDTYLNLSQTGTVKDQQVTVAEVFVDLPIIERSTHLELISDASEAPFSRRRRNIVRALVERFDMSSGTTEISSNSLKQVVVIGGPGQGKSTATQFLAQMYRARFLEGSSVENDPELTPALQPLRERLTALKLEGPRARRWPIRILLTDLADSLAESRCNSLLEYISQAVSHRSSVTVTTSQMRGWLKSYPWLLMVDGLDEVPNSSNRTQVLTCIKDFFHDVKLLKSDVAIVATTRPQGYDDDFNPEHYSHLNLASLPIGVALSYAQGFISVRAGDGTSKATRIYDRLVKASKDDTTARLFSSPLQVTILTVLIEKLGRVPQDRWRLFSQYYNVISQRELEKGGELSDLLQTYENDVEYLHRYIGHLLQERAAEAGETSSTISRDEFQQIISERLTTQGHSSSEVDRLAGEFLRLATDRLVFLAFVQADRVGFEIRSLQEYMSAWHLVSGPESEIISEITDRSLAPYWRNVVLFAVGSIFTTKDHLKADVLNMCIEIDLANASSKLSGPGSVLALDILLDGSCHAQPAYARPLSDRASQLVDGPLQRRVADFAKFSGSEIADIFRSEVLKVSPAAAHTWANRAIALDAMCANDLASDVELEALISAASTAGIEMMLELVGSGSYRYLISALEARVGDFSPKHLLRNYPRQHGFDLAEAKEIFPAWILPLIQLSPSLREGLSFSVESSNGTVSYSFNALAENAEAWELLAECTFPHPSWTMLRCVGKFVVSPSMESLAEVLEAMAEVPREDHSLMQAAPWVVTSCYDAASNYTPYFQGFSAASAFRALAVAARSGSLGDENTWRSAENRWQNGAEFTAESFAFQDLALEGAHLPFTAEIASSGAVPFGVNMTFMRGVNDDLSKQLAEPLAYARMLSKTSCPMQLATLFTTVTFLSSVAIMTLGNDLKKIEESAEAQELFGLIVDAIPKLADGSPIWIGWLPAAPPTWHEDEECSSIIRHISRLNIIGKIYVDFEDDLRWIDKLGIPSDMPHMQMLISIGIESKYIRKFSREQLRKILEYRRTFNQQDLIFALCVVLTSSMTEIEGGDADSALHVLLCDSTDRDLLDLDLILSVLELQSSESRQAIIVRVFDRFVETTPTRVSKVLEVLA